MIRRAQMTVFENKVHSDFVSDLADYLFDHRGEAVVRLPERASAIATMARPELEQLVLGGIKRAAHYGLRWRSALASFVVTMFVVAPNFDQDHQVRAVLTDSNIDPNYRMDALRRQMTEDQWTAIHENYDVKSWGRQS